MSDQLLNMREARAELNVNHRTLTRLIRDAGVELFENPADRRVLLVRRDDLAKIATPRPLGRPTEGGMPSSTAA